MASRVNEIKTGGLIGDDLVCNVNINTEIVNIERAKGISFDVFLNNNDATGSISVQGCNYIEVNGSGNWVNVELSNGATSVAVASGVNTSALFDFDGTYFKYAKVIFVDTNSGGSAVDNLLKVYAHPKGPF